jgi:hypothetical protein
MDELSFLDVARNRLLIVTGLELQDLRQIG